VAIVSNQSGLGRGMMDQNTFNTIHAKMMLAIEQAGGFITHVAYCPHTPDDDCNCRKPRPGMVVDSITACSTTTDKTIMIGDSLRDMQAAHAAGVTGILVQSGYGDADTIVQATRSFMPEVQAFDNLAAAVDVILGDTK